MSATVRCSTAAYVRKLQVPNRQQNLDTVTLSNGLANCSMTWEEMVVVSLLFCPNHRDWWACATSGNIAGDGDAPGLGAKCTTGVDSVA